MRCMEGYITTREAAEELGVSDSRIRQLIREGKLRSVKLTSRMQVIRSEDLDAVRERGSSGWPKGKPRKKAEE